MLSVVFCCVGCLGVLQRVSVSDKQAACLSSFSEGAPDSSERNNRIILEMSI